MPPGEIRPNIRPWGILTNDPSQRGCFFPASNSRKSRRKASPCEKIWKVSSVKIGSPLFWVFPNCISSLTERFHMFFSSDHRTKLHHNFILSYRFVKFNFRAAEFRDMKILYYVNYIFDGLVFWIRKPDRKRQSERNT